MVNTRVLIVEDDDEILELMTMMLEMSECVVTTAPNGFAALELVKAGKEFDMVVTDLSMPGMDGRKLIACLRDMGFDKPIMAVSGYLLSDPVPGADKTMSKPFKMQDFVGEVIASLDE